MELARWECAMFGFVIGVASASMLLTLAILGA